MKNIILLIALGLSPFAFAGPEHEHPKAQISPEFEKLKGLIGTWEGKNMIDGKEQATKVTYELTSGGTAIVEKMAPGSPHEMVTVYSNSGKNVNMTHFCAMGNQPQLKLQKADGTNFNFVMDGTKGIANKNEMHMHSLNVSLNGNKLKQEWISFKDNKKSDVMVFEFTKK